MVLSPEIVKKRLLSVLMLSFVSVLTLELVFEIVEDALRVT